MPGKRWINKRSRTIEEAPGRKTKGSTGFLPGDSPQRRKNRLSYLPRGEEKKSKRRLPLRQRKSGGSQLRKRIK